MIMRNLEDEEYKFCCSSSVEASGLPKGGGAKIVSMVHIIVCSHPNPI